jgi:hypothetical protein
MTIPASAPPTKLPYDRVDLLLVEGEIVTDAEGRPRRVWPTQREVAQRFGVAPSLVGAFASQRNCTARRKAFEAALPSGPPGPAQARANDGSTETPSDAAEAEGSDDLRRGPGRPRRAEGPAFPRDKVFDALVYGEVVQSADGTATTEYPTYREVAERYGVAISVIAEYAKSRNVLKRRELARARFEARKEEKLIELRADAVAFDEARMLQVLDEMFANYATSVTEGRMRFDNVGDLDKLWRLKSFIQGGPDSRQEVQGAITLEALQQRYETMLRNTREVTLEMTGYVPRVIDGVVVRDVEDEPATAVHVDADGAQVTPPRPPSRAMRFALREPILALLAQIPRLLECGRRVCAVLDAESASDPTLPEVRLLALIDEADALMRSAGEQTDDDEGAEQRDVRFGLSAQDARDDDDEVSAQGLE